MKHVFPIIVLCLLAAGCARTKFSAYVGQQPQWPTTPGAFVQVKRDVKVYRGYPERPYEVIGSVELRRAAIADLEFAAATAARRHGADAAIIVASARGRREARVSVTYLEFLEGHATFPHSTAGPFPLQEQTATVYLARFK